MWEKDVINNRCNKCDMFFYSGRKCTRLWPKKGISDVNINTGAVYASSLFFIFLQRYPMQSTISKYFKSVLTTNRWLYYVH